MNIKKVLFGAALVVVGLPVVVATVAVVSVRILDRTNGSLLSSGETRRYLLHVPPSYDGSEAVPLVVSFHAGAAWPAQQRNLSGWNRLADEHGFIVVYPAGAAEIAALGMPRIWAVDREADRTRDVRFISDLISALETSYRIDPKRVYVDGMSNGGAMAFVLSCTLSDRIAAIGLVAAAQSRPFEWCTDDRPVPMIAFHGTADPVVPYSGGRLGDPFNPVKPVYPPVRDFTASWARRNGCAADPAETAAAADVLRLEHTACDEDAAVVLYTVQGGGHAWPGGKPMPEWRVGPHTDSVDATRLIWDFFREHPLRARAVRSPSVEP